MATQCRHFVQNAWKKELCSNCFKSREEHASAQEQSRPVLAKTASGVRRVAHKVQGILRLRESNGSGQVRNKRKTVAFLESLTEIIGYDGGDDMGSDEDNSEDAEYGQPQLPDDSDGGSSSCEHDADEQSDMEEERALGNLTRANTNFNTVTANLSMAPQASENKSPPRNFGPLMLGRAQKDSDGKKKTLLVTVTPFGADDSLPTARRPLDKKPLEVVKPKFNHISNNNNNNSLNNNNNNNNHDNSETTEIKPELASIKTPKRSVVEEKATEAPSASATATAASATKTKAAMTTSASNLGKIVDMPLITSSSSLLASLQHQQREEPKESKRGASSIARSPAIKKPESEKPRIARETATSQASPSDALRNQKNLELSELEHKSEEARESCYKSLADLAERKVEGEAASGDKYRFEESRESAGEPDGKADEELVAEPPALPKSSPPPLDAAFPREPESSGPSPDKSASQSSGSGAAAEPRASFLHGLGEANKGPRPLVPQKPAALPSKPQAASLASLLSESRAHEYRLSQAQSASLELGHSRSDSQLSGSPRACPEPAPKPNDEQAQPESEAPEEEEEELPEEEPEEEESSEGSSSSEQPSRKRRQAPPPPSSGPAEESGPAALFARNPNGPKSSCPVVREKEKRERASSCSPKFRQVSCESPDPRGRPPGPPEPAPRRNISLSQDSLAATGFERVEEKKKARSKFSLKKFLRMGTRKDVDMTGGSSLRSDEIPSTPQPKPRLEIIHPLELDGAAVQVLRAGNVAEASSPEPRSENPSQPSPAHLATRPSKPPPPPRAQSLDDASRVNPRALPPKQQQQQQQPSSNGKPLAGKSWQPSASSSASDSIYANLAAEDVAGVGRSGLAPIKPRRSSSMRDQPSQPSPLGKAQEPEPSPASLLSKYSEALGRSAEPRAYCERSSLELRQALPSRPAIKRQSDSGALDSASSSSDLSFQQSLFARSSSLPHCAGEYEAEIYSGFSYRLGDENSEDGEEWKKDESCRIGRLRQRRGRSIVHRSLEDNYGAVILANHEALGQFLEQMSKQRAAVPLGLRALDSANLRLSEFVIERSSILKAARRFFFSATWNEQQVTLCLSFELALQPLSRSEFRLLPIVEFVDRLPRDLELAPPSPRKSAEATIWVLPRLQVHSIKTFAEAMRLESGKEENAMRESSFLLLQLVTALKSLQARGIEEAPGSLDNVVLCREEKDSYHRVYMFQSLNIDVRESEEEEEQVSLCQCALNALDQLNLGKKLPLVRELLAQEKAVTLSQVKSLLEFGLWGPGDAALGGPRERELALQRWLDLERATLLQALVRAPSHLGVADEYQLLFLVRTSAKMMCEASLLLDRQRAADAALARAS